MHGIVHAEFQKYFIIRHGHPIWKKLLSQAGLGTKSYLVSQHYPDSEILRLVTAASQMTGKPIPTMLEDFGQFIVPDLIDMYVPMLDPQWRTLDVVEHTERTIHQVVRLRNPGASPPELKCRRVSAGEVQVSYSSARKMCALARGIIRGLAKHFEETVQIEEGACMHQGAPSCEISVRLAAPASQAKRTSSRPAAVAPRTPWGRPRTPG
jgi:Haem-NO-binding